MPRFSLEARKRLTLAATALGSSLAFVDATVVFVAMPTIERDLVLGLAGVQWLFLSYSLALASLYLVGGALGDRYGRRRLFLVGTVAFALTSLLAGAAWNGGVLIGARALQGVAGAFLTTNSLALLRSVYGDEAGGAIGRWTALTSVATLGAPVLGGALVEWASWRWIFFVNLPLAGLAVAFALAGRCDEQRQLRTGRLDIPGAVLAAAAFGLLTYGLVEGAERGLGELWWAFAGGTAALAAFVAVEARVAEPMLPLVLFRRRNFAFANLETLLAYGAIYGVIVFAFNVFPQFLGFSPLQTGLLNIPVTAALLLLAARFGALADRRGPRAFLAAGPALLGVSVLLLLGVEERADFWLFGLPALAVFALGLAVLVAPITAVALKSAPAELSGVASGVNSTVSRVGSLLTVAVVGAVVTLVFERERPVAEAADAVPLAKDQAGEALRAASLSGFRAGMLIAAGLAFAAAIVGALAITNRAGLPVEEVTEAAPAAVGS